MNRPIGYLQVKRDAEGKRPKLEIVASEVPAFRPVRPSLQQRSNVNVRRHGLRSARRILVLALLDAAVVLLLAGLADVFRAGILGQWPAWMFPPGFLGGYRFYPALLIGLAASGSYGRGDTRRHPGRIFSGVAIATAMALWSPLWYQNALLTVLQFAVVSFVLATMLTSARLLLDRALRSRPETSAGIPTLLVGPADDCAYVSKSELFAQGSAHSILGFVTPDGTGALGSFADLGRLIPEHGVETVFIAGNLPETEFAYVVDTSLAADCELLAYPRRLVRSGVQPSIAYHEGMPLLQLHLPGLRAWQLVIKRISDIIGSAILLVVLAPLFAIISVAVLVTSGAPVFYSQSRVGKGGRPFRIFKFRSMHNDADGRIDELRERSLYADARLFKLENDPRVTRLGRFLRSTSLDELPQLWNVLRGDMALVGPRPPRPEEVVLYEEHHYCRFDVRPGITGPWQVSGRNLITDFEEVVRLEQNYIRRWSFFHDLRILVETIPAVLRGRGAH